MKTIVFKFWLINLLTGIALFVLYRITIAQTKTIDGNAFEKWMQILKLVLNLGFSFIYLIAITISSLAVFFNLINKVSKNFYLSLATFLAIPSFCIGYLFIINGLLGSVSEDETVFSMLLIFSFAYLLLTSIEFLLFRKRIEKLIN